MKLFKSFFIFIILTVISQIGGFIYLGSELIHPRFTSKMSSKFSKRMVKLLIFLVLYLVISLFAIPPLAKQFGRVPLPFLFNENEHLKPASLFYGFANRHYVKPELYDEILGISEKFCGKHKDLKTLTYLDANFPFIDNYPLFPHKSHDDGEKLDLSFLFRKGDKLLMKSPSLLGYGYVEGPKAKEVNQADLCAEENKYYSMLKVITRQDKKGVSFDSRLNKDLLRTLSKSKTIKKIFIEPHLKSRLGLRSQSKIRFQGCKAVRHDDHIHVQM